MRTDRLLTVSQHALLVGVVPAQGVYLPGGVYLARGVYLPRGVYLARGGGLPAQVFPPVNRMTDRQV